MRSIFIIFRDEAMRRALKSFVSTAELDADVTDGPDLFSVYAPRGSVIVSSVADMSSHTVGYLAKGHDLQFLVLAPMPTKAAREEYEGHGASYVPMTVDRESLMGPLRAMLA